MGKKWRNVLELENGVVGGRLKEGGGQGFEEAF